MNLRLPDFSRLSGFLKKRSHSEGLLPFELVKYFAFTALLFVLVASLILSWVISNNARSFLLQRSEAYAELFAENLNRQVFLQFVLPTVVRYGRIQISEKTQHERLDQVVNNVTRGMPIDSVTIFDSRANIIAYSTRAELMGKQDMGGLEYRKALEGENSTILIYGGSLISLLPGMPTVYCTLRTYVPFRQENRLGVRTGEIMGVIEVVQDLSDDLKTIIQLQGRIIVLSLVIMGVLFAILGMIVVKANRIMARRAAERLRLEEELNESQRLATLGKMVAAVSHEIKNPLGIVRSTAEILGKRITKVAPGNEHLATIIVEETSRLDSIVREFLDFARPREVKLKATSLNVVVERLVRFMEPEFKKCSIYLILQLDDDLPEVMVDSEQVYQVFFNIVFNGIQAMPEGGTLTLRTGHDVEDKLVSLSVRDTGGGIAEEKIDQIFTPFYTDKNRGTGLGLAIARNIVDKHHGKIRVKSRQGEGSTFIVILPISHG